MWQDEVFGTQMVTEELVSVRRFQQVYQVKIRPQDTLEFPNDAYSYMVKIGQTKFTVVADTPLELKTRRDNFLKSYRAGNDFPYVAGTIRIVNEANFTVRYV